MYELIFSWIQITCPASHLGVCIFAKINSQSKNLPNYFLSPPLTRNYDINITLVGTSVFKIQQAVTLRVILLTFQFLAAQLDTVYYICYLNEDASLLTAVARQHS
jgi:hypothetical protein